MKPIRTLCRDYHGHVTDPVTDIENWANFIVRKIDWDERLKIGQVE
jgi:hypothetical protein